LTLGSGSGGDLSLSSATGLVVLSATTLQATDSVGLDLTSALDTTFAVQNSGAGVAHLNITEGGLQTAGTLRLTNAGVLQNITGLTVSSGTASFNGNVTIGDTSSDRLTITSQLLGANALVFQGATDNGFATTLTITDPTANNTITVPDASGTLVLDSRSITTAVGSGLTGGGDLSVDRSLSLDILSITSKTNVNPNDYIAVYDDTTSSLKKISRNDFLQGVVGAMQYRGSWNAAGNIPTLTDGIGTAGETYVVSVGGTQNFGFGPPITFAVGDFVIYSGSNWEKVTSSSTVDSVFGRTGVITAQSGDYSALQISNTPSGTISSTNVQAAINELATEKMGSLNGLTSTSQTFANDTNVTITSSGSTHTLGWNGQLSVARGGTGASTFTSNGVLYGNGTGALQVSSAGTGGQVLLANASGVPTFTTLTGDITVSSTGVVTLGAGAVTLGTETVGNYVANLGTLTGLSTTGNTGEGSTPTLSVLYGSTANTAVQGNTSLTLTAGTNLSGAVTLGAGGTVTFNTVANPSFGTSVTTPLLTSTAGLDITSGGTGDITLDSASNKLIIDGTDTTLERTGIGSYTIDLKDNAATSLVLSNSTAGGSSFANLNLADGALQIAGTTVIGNDRSLQNLAGITNVGAFTTSGGIASLNVNSNFATNINTGTSAGAVTIGGGSNSLTINSLNFDVTSAGAVSGVTTLALSGAISGATATNTINGLIINAGSLSGITGFTQTSGNFAMSGTGTFSTGTGAVSLNGAVTASSTLTATGLTTLNGGLTIQTGDTLTFNAQAFTDLTGNGLTLSGTSLTIDVTTAGTVAGTSSNSGLITAADGLSLLRGCSNAQILKWNGTAWACATDNTGLSDSRLKENVTSIGSVLDNIKNVNVVNFNFKCADPTYASMNFTCNQQTGVIAQDLGAIFPGLVTINEQGFNQVDFGALNFYTLKAVTELAQKIDGSGNATLNTVSTGGELRLSQSGALQNINGLTMNSGGASVVGGLNNNNGGITSAGSISGVTGISAQSITLAATGNQNLLTLTKDGSGVFTVFNSGALQLQLDNAQALAVKAANGDNALTVDTLTGKIRIGSGNSGKTFLFVLDTKSTAGDPEGTNGAQYYNGDSDKFRCYQGGEWQDCVQTAYSEYSVMSVPGPWVQPSGDTEFPAQNRTWIELRNANQFRILANLTAAGAQNATCRMQYATDTETSNPQWHNLSSANDGGAMHINGTGALKGEWTPVAKDSKKESLVRVLCTGGDQQTAPNFTNIRIQVR
jgi:hypothetical protein